MSFPGSSGDTLPERGPETLITDMRIELVPLDLIVQWHRCSMMSEFLAEYMALHFVERDAARQALSTGLNELIENIAKFSADKRQRATLSIAHHGDHLRITTANEAEGQRARALAERLDRIAVSDAEELFLEQIEHTATNDRAASGLGLITIRKDYGALMGAEIQPVDGVQDRFTVVFSVDLDVRLVESI